MLNRATGRALGLVIMMGLVALSAARGNAADATAAAPPGVLPFVHAQGTRFVDEQGRPVVLRGCNLGNWLLFEPWMLGRGDLSDQHELTSLLAERFGAEEAWRLMDVYRAGYVTERDLPIVRSFGMNVVRLPFHWSLVQEEQPPYRMREDAFKWLDRAVDLCEANGLYIILDLHGVPGGQSTDMPTGRRNQNRLWTDEQCQQRTEQIWRAIAARYRDRSVVAGYDLVNEPFGDFRQDLRQPLLALMERLYRAVREVDDRHIIFMPGTLQYGVDFYGEPAARGWRNVAFTEHWYPGLFGSPATLEYHARILGRDIPRKQRWLDRVQAPYFVGEFNIVLHQSGGVRTMRRYWDAFAQQGWAVTMWSYKILKPEGGAGSANWYLATNAAPMPRIDFRTAGKQEIEAFLASFATMELAIDEAQRQALTAPQPPAILLSEYPELPTTAPATGKVPAPWTASDIGKPLAGGSDAPGEGQFTLYASGTDIFNTRDAFHFLHQPVQGDCTLAARVVSLLESAEYAKAGVMLRASLEPDAPFAMVNTFPDGTIAFCYRRAVGDRCEETKTSAPPGPVHLRLTRQGRTVRASWCGEGAATWQTLGEAEVALKPQAHSGLAACSQDPEFFTVARFDQVRVNAGDDAAATPVAAQQPQPQQLLRNDAFEEAGDPSDLPAHWRRWGQWLNHESTWTPTHSGKGMLGYHHWQIENGNDTGLWQNIRVQSGQRYTFSVYFSHDKPGADQRGADSIELRLEGTIDGRQVTIQSRDWSVGSLPAGDGNWSRLAVSGTAPSEDMRALIRIIPAKEGPRGGAVKLDDAALTPALRTDGR